METQNAIPSQDAAMGNQEAIERNFGLPEEIAEGKAPREGHPTPEAKQERTFAGKYKSVEDLEKAHKELESKLGRDAEERKQLKDTLNSYETRLSAAEQARVLYDQAMNQQRVPAHSQPDPDQVFKQVVNEDERVLNSVKSLTHHVSEGLLNEKVNPEIQRMRTEIQRTKANNFQLGLEMKKSANQDLAALMPEIQQVAQAELSDLQNRLLSQGVDPRVVQATIEDLNTDLGYVDSLYKKVRGSKPAEYWAGVLKTSAQKEIEDAKNQLGGGGASGDSGSSQSEEQFQRLLAKDGSSLEARNELVRKGILRARK